MAKADTTVRTNSYLFHLLDGGDASSRISQVARAEIQVEMPQGDGTFFAVSRPYIPVLNRMTDHVCDAVDQYVRALLPTITDVLCDVTQLTPGKAIDHVIMTPEGAGRIGSSFSWQHADLLSIDPTEINSSAIDANGKLSKPAVARMTLRDDTILALSLEITGDGFMIFAGSVFLSLGTFAPHDHIARTGSAIKLWERLDGFCWVRKAVDVTHEIVVANKDRLADFVASYFCDHQHLLEHDAFVLVNDPWLEQQESWTTGSRSLMKKWASAALHYLSHAKASGQVMYTLTTDNGYLPNIDFLRSSRDADLNHIHLHQDMAFILECLFSLWKPTGHVMAAHSHPAVRRSHYKMHAPHDQFDIHLPSAHQAMAANKIFRELVQIIDLEQPWDTDPSFGRRTNLLKQDCAAIYQRIITHYRTAISSPQQPAA